MAGPDHQAANEKIAAPVDKQTELLQQVMAQLENSGDLPIFSASVNQIQMVGSDPESDAMQLAVEVLKDANLTTKMLRLANSSYYNRGSVKVGSLSRAVVVLGFDAVKSTVLALKLIDSMQDSQPESNMSSMLVNSYMSAGLVKEMAAASGVKNYEQSYVCGLLHNLGEVIVSYTLPEKYREMKQMLHDEALSWSDVQKKVLGMPLQTIGKGIVEKWNFPESISKTIAPHVTMKRKVQKQDATEMNRSLSSLSTRMMDLLYSEHPTTQQSFSEITKELSSVSGLNEDVVGNCLDKSFKQSCDLAEDYGLDKTLLIPKFKASDDEERDIIARKLGAFAGYEEPPEAVDAGFMGEDEDDGYSAEAEELLAPEELEDAQSMVVPGGDTSVMLTVLQELTSMMTNNAHLNTVFNKVLEGMHRGVGFDRAMLCLISPDHKTYSGRMAIGYRADGMKKMFNECKIDTYSDLFSKMILEDNELLIADVSQGNWLQKLPAGFEEKVGAKSILIAALRVRNRPVGMFYVDKARQQTMITGEQQRGFLQLVAQAQLALKVR